MLYTIPATNMDQRASLMHLFNITQAGSGWGETINMNTGPET